MNKKLFLITFGFIIFSAFLILNSFGVSAYHYNYYNDYSSSYSYHYDYSSSYSRNSYYTRPYYSYPYYSYSPYSYPYGYYSPAYYELPPSTTTYRVYWGEQPRHYGGYYSSGYSTGYYGYDGGRVYRSYYY